MGDPMAEYLQFGMSGIAALMMLIGLGQLFSHKDNETPWLQPSDPGSQKLAIAEHNVRMLRSVGDQIIGAVLISGGFVGAAILWR